MKLLFPVLSISLLACLSTPAMSGDLCGTVDKPISCDQFASKEIKKVNPDGSISIVTQVVKVCAEREPKNSSATAATTGGNKILTGYPCGVQTTDGDNPGAGCNSSFITIFPCPE